MTPAMQDLMACERLGIHPFGGRPWDGLDVAEQTLVRWYDRVRRAQERRTMASAVVGGTG